MLDNSAFQIINLDLLKNNEIRALLDDRNETIGKKIRESELSKTPYMLIIGEKEPFTPQPLLWPAIKLLVIVPT